MRSLIPLVLLLAAGCPAPSDPDQDGDGFTADVDCDDANAEVNPAASEVCGNGIDDNCDGDTDLTGVGDRIFWADDDADGYGDSATSRTACTTPEGFVDNDEDCNDDDKAINPAAADDQCDDVDNDCDDETDEDAATLTVFADTDGDTFGDATASSLDCKVRDGFTTDATDCDDDAATTYPGAPELCNGVDDSCDEVVDEGLAGSGEACPDTSCKTLLDGDSTLATGDYWLSDGRDGAFQARCDMTTDGGGWTRITGAILKDNELYTVPTPRGPVGAYVAEWYGLGDLELDPFKSGGDECDTVVVRMRAQLPFTFGAWWGSFDAFHAGNDTVATSWGEEIDVDSTVKPPCDGSVKFGATFNTEVKFGGEWGGGHSDTEPVTWSRTELVRPTNEFTWEINDMDPGMPDAILRISKIEIWVR